MIMGNPSAFVEAYVEPLSASPESHQPQGGLGPESVEITVVFAADNPGPDAGTSVSPADNAQSFEQVQLSPPDGTALTPVAWPAPTRGASTA